MASVECYFDYTCPWSYLAFVRLSEAAKRTGSKVRWCPVVLDKVLELVNPGVSVVREPADPRKAAYQVSDLEAWADYVGIAIDRPAGWPADSSLAAAGGIVADRQGAIAAFTDAVFSAYFGMGRNVADPGVLTEIAVIAGLDRESFEEALNDELPANDVATNVNTLLERGGFGAPTMFVREQMFFGNDRMPLVEFALGQSSGRTFIMPGQHG